MIIDIINYTEEQYAALSAEKLQEIREAQLKKNKLLQSLAERLAAEKARLVDRGIFRSSIWTKRETELTAACNAEIEVVREALLFYLRYAGTESGSGEDKVPSGVPYTVDYSLNEEERLLIVKEYYLNAYSNGQARFDAFEADAFARSYLGELYAPLWHYFQDLI